MVLTQTALLGDRGLLSVRGEDAKAFLDNLITNDMDLLDRQDALHAALLTPQGKIMFVFFVAKATDGYVLDTDSEHAAGLAKRLGLYKLRAKVVIEDISDRFVVAAAWGEGWPTPAGAISYADPRHRDLGRRVILGRDLATRIIADADAQADYDKHRLALGIPEAGQDYVLGDTFPHEANFDRLGGVSFTKGCFVGQEVVARMQHKTVVRKRVVRLSGTAPLTSGTPVSIGAVAIGTIGSTAGNEALAMLRLDRALEAESKGEALTAGGAVVTVHGDDLAPYAAAAAAKAGGA